MPDFITLGQPPAAGPLRVETRELIPDTHRLAVQPGNANLPTYHVFVENYAGYATPTDMLLLRGATGRVVRVQHAIVFAGQDTQSTAPIAFSWIRRSTANTAGTATQPPIMKLDAADPNPLAVVDLYSAAPTLGAGVTLGKSRGIITAKATANPSAYQLAGVLPLGTGVSLGEPVTLRGPAEGFAINFGGVALAAGFSADLYVSWTESTY